VQVEQDSDGCTGAEQHPNTSPCGDDAKQSLEVTHDIAGPSGALFGNSAAPSVNAAGYARLGHGAQHSRDSGMRKDVSLHAALHGYPMRSTPTAADFARNPFAKCKSIKEPPAAPMPPPGVSSLKKHDQSEALLNINTAAESCLEAMKDYNLAEVPHELRSLLQVRGLHVVYALHSHWLD
jgi:hypothetical protein